MTKRRFAWRRWLFILLSVALLAVVASQFTSAQALGVDLSKADLRWAAVALVMQAAFFLLYGGLYQAGFSAVGVTSRAVSLVPVLLASIFAKTAVPFTAAPAAAVFIDDATTRGEGMSIVFFIIAIVPDGIGAVEGAMALVFVQLGMAPTAAILVTVAYRILNVWLPVAIGFWCARRLRLFGAGERARSPRG